MAEFNIKHGIAGLLFLEGVGQGYNVISATNSSPQTTEVYGGADGGKRTRTLMKWVYIGHAQVLIFMGLASIIAKSLWPLIGGGLVVATMHGCYRHAKRCAENGAGEIDYGGGAAVGQTDMRAGDTSVPTSGGAPLRTR